MSDEKTDSPKTTATRTPELTLKDLPKVPDYSGIDNYETVNHPPHYGGKDSPYEAIKVIEAWQLGFNLGNTLKYIAREGKKDAYASLDDLRKAAFYLNREIENRTGGIPG